MTDASYEITVGSLVKVWVPGETPWAEVVKVKDNGFIGRIDNKLAGDYTPQEWHAMNWRMFDYDPEDWPEEAEPLPQLHNYKYNDKVHFVKHRDGRFVPLFDQDIADTGMQGLAN